MVKTKKIPKLRIFKGASRVEGLMSFLILNGYTCVLEKHFIKEFFIRTTSYSKGVFYPASSYISVHIEHPHVCAMWCNINDDSYQNMSGYICIDNKKMFNKWTQAPIVISLNESNEVILDYLKKIETDEFAEISNSYGIIRNDFDVNTL